jgi:hypothetical protein
VLHDEGLAIHMTTIPDISFVIFYL